MSKTETLLDKALSRIDGYHDAGADVRRMSDLERGIRGLGLADATKTAHDPYKQALHGDDPQAVIDTRRAWQDAVHTANHALEAERDIRTERELLRSSAHGHGAEATVPALRWLHE